MYRTYQTLNLKNALSINLQCKLKYNVKLTSHLHIQYMQPQLKKMHAGVYICI